MKQSQCTGLVPANDNPHDERQAEMFPDRGFLGVDFGSEHAVGVVGRIQDDGSVVVERLIELEPEGAA